MRKLLVSAFCALLVCGGAAAIDLTGLRSIGPVTAFSKTESGVTLNCADGSEVRITVLAPDLIRVRAAFLGKLPARDHSWAIEKTSWDAPRWDLAEDSGTLRISTERTGGGGPPLAAPDRIPRRQDAPDHQCGPAADAIRSAVGPGRRRQDPRLRRALLRPGREGHAARQAPRRIQPCGTPTPTPTRKAPIRSTKAFRSTSAGSAARPTAFSSTTATGPTSISARLPRSTPRSRRRAAR